MPTEPPRADPPKRKRRWFQFSLRTLLVFTMALAVACGWLGKRIEQKREEREAVEAIVKSGGYAQYDYQGETDGEPPGPNWLRKLLGEDFFSEVTLVNINTRGGDAELEHVNGLTKVKALVLVEITLINAAVGRLSTKSNNISDAGLENLEGLTQLEVLVMGGPRITDAGLERLRRLTQLRELCLDYTQVTDAGLAHLKGLTHLQFLGLPQNLWVTLAVERGGGWIF
jgi:hypothetical protein